MAPSWAGVGGRGGWRKEVEVQWGRSLGRWGGWAWPKMRPQRGRHREPCATARSTSQDRLPRCHPR